MVSTLTKLQCFVIGYPMLFGQTQLKKAGGILNQNNENHNSLQGILFKIGKTLRKERPATYWEFQPKYKTRWNFFQLDRVTSQFCKNKHKSVIMILVFTLDYIFVVNFFLFAKNQKVKKKLSQVKKILNIRKYSSNGNTDMPILS